MVFTANSSCGRNWTRKNINGQVVVVGSKPNSLARALRYASRKRDCWGLVDDVKKDQMVLQNFGQEGRVVMK